jgi:ankyrin repeat protein
MKKIIKKIINNNTLLQFFFKKSNVFSGVNPNACDQLKRTGLHIAASRGYIDVVKLLLESGADPNTTDSINNTALHIGF